MADASDISAISALLKIAKDVEAKKLRRAQEDAALMVEEKEGRESLLSNRRGLERQLEDELEDSRKSANEEEEKKAQELTTRQDEEMISLKLKHIQARVQLVEENKAVRSHLMAIELARDSELVKEIEGKEKAFEATVQAKKEGLQAAREAEDENERATIQRNSTILTQLRGLWLPSQPVQTSSNTHSEFTTSPRAQGIPANNVNAQLHRGQLHGKNVDNNVHSDGTQRSVQGSPSNDDDRLARMELEIQRNKRQNEEVFGPYPTVTPPHGEKRPHVSEQSGAISNTPSSPATSASSASTLSCIVVENLQTPKRRRLESATNGEAMAATSPSPSTPTSTSRFGHAPQSANGIENTPGSASRFTVSTIRDALPTPSPTPSTPPSPSPAGTRTPQKASKSSAVSGSSISAPPIPNKIYSVRHFRSTKPDDTSQLSIWRPTPKHQTLSIKWGGHKFQPLPVKGSNNKSLPVEFTIEPGRVWNFEYSLAKALVHMNRKAGHGQDAWVEFEDKETLEAFIDEYKSRWPEKVLTEKPDLKLPD